MRLGTFFAIGLGVTGLGHLTACLDEHDIDSDAAAITVTPSDSQRHPTDHGSAAFGAAHDAELTDAARFHAWTFELGGPAELAIATGPVPGSADETDTVLLLHREGPSGWGRYIARNDDAGDGRWSALTRSLDAGRYRVLVKGYRDDTRGAFALTVACTGAGCSAPASCLFGETFRDLDRQPALRVTGRVALTSAADLTDLDRRRVVLAVQQSSHTDVTTAEEAFARVDQGVIHRVHIYEPAAARTFVAFEYGAGDNSYGAFFDGLSDTLVARIHDGDLLDCTVVAETCLLGSTYGELRANPDFSGVSSRRVTEPTHLAGIEAEQAIRAVAESWPDVTTLADAIDATDDGAIHVTGLFHDATGTELLAFEYGAGDSSYGAVFYAGSLSLAAAIHDGDFYGCTFLAGSTSR